MTVSLDAVDVLHVDDDPEFAELVATYLEREDDRIRVVTATSPEAGFDYLESRSIDCVVSDYEMPETDGLEFLDRVRERYDDLPFVLFTGKGSEEIASEAITAGVTDYLQKGTGTEQYAILANRVLNVVERRRSKRRLEERNRRLETLISNLPGIVYRYLPEEGCPIEYVEGECEAITGYAPADLESGAVSWGEDVVYEDEEERTRAVQTALDADEPFETTYRIETKAGAVRRVWERGRGVYEDGDPVAVEGFITDTLGDGRTGAEFSRRRSQRLFEAVFNTPDSFMGVLDTDGTLREANRTALEFADADPEDVRGRPFHETPWWNHSEDLQERVREWIRRAADGEHVRAESTHVAPDGTEVVVDNVFRPVVENGEVVSVVAEGRNVTDRVERERDLAFFERLVESVGVGVAAYDAAGRFEYVNPEYAAMLDADRERLLSLTVADVNPEFDQARFDEYWASFEDGETRVEEAVHEVGDTSVPVRTVTTRREIGDETYHFGTITDLSERKERERALQRQNERLEEFASIVSHDLRNPLNVAEGQLELAREECDSEHLAEIEWAHGRMRTLIEDLLTLARKGTAVEELETVALGSVADECWPEVASERATLVVETDRRVRADGSRLRQLLENLFRNALEHGGEDVTVTVGDAEDGFYVADDGPGIPEGERDRVFETGYTTTDDGTGFGLSIVEEIALAHGWTVAVTDAASGDGAGGGARFEITGVEFVG